MQKTASSWKKFFFIKLYNIKKLVLLLFISTVTLSFQIKEVDHTIILSNAAISIEHEIDAKALYTTTCKACHGKKGNSKFAGVKPLTKSILTLKEAIEIITNGKEGTAMIGYKSIYSPKEIKAI